MVSKCVHAQSTCLVKGATSAQKLQKNTKKLVKGVIEF